MTVHSTTTLGEICSVQPGLAGSRRLLPPGADRGAPVITVADVGGESLPHPASLRRFASRNPLTRYLVRAGDILFRARGDRPTATVLDRRYREPAVAVLPLFILRPDRSRVVPRYLAWAINRPASQHHFARVARGTGTLVVLRGGIESLRIALPGLGAQRRIVEVDRLAEREFRLALRAAEARRGLVARVVDGWAEGMEGMEGTERGRGAEGGTRWLA